MDACREPEKKRETGKGKKDRPIAGRGSSAPERGLPAIEALPRRKKIGGGGGGINDRKSGGGGRKEISPPDGIGSGKRWRRGKWG